MQEDQEFKVILDYMRSLWSAKEKGVPVLTEFILKILLHI